MRNSITLLEIEKIVDDAIIENKNFDNFNNNDNVIDDVSETDEDFMVSCAIFLHNKHKSLQFKCEECQEKFCSFQQFMQHIKKHFQTTINTTHNDDIKNNALVDVQLPNQWQVINHNVDEHLNIELLDTNSIDDKHESIVEDIVKHSKRKQTVVKNCNSIQQQIFKCTECELQLSSANCLKQHQSVHSNERIYKCKICNKSLKHGYNLKVHMRRHTGIKPYTCIYCNKKFITRPELYTHERYHTGERPFICSKCGQRFISSGRLNEHTKRHLNNKPHKCTYCDKRFYDTYQLKSHLIVHTKERKFVCNICNKEFSRHKSLTTHMKIHANKREYECSLCDAKYNQRNAYTMHMRNHHHVLITCNQKFCGQEKNSIIIETIKCLRCHLKLQHKTELQQHLIEFHHDEENLTNLHKASTRNDDDDDNYLIVDKNADIEIDVIDENDDENVYINYELENEYINVNENIVIMPPIDVANNNIVDGNYNMSNFAKISETIDLNILNL